MLSHIHRAFAKQYKKLWRKAVYGRHVGPYVDTVPADATILEIGGGYNPRFTKSRYRNAYHLDHCSAAELRTKYAALPAVARDAQVIQEVDFIFTGAPIETLVPPDLRFDVIYGSHVLEHQVDLISHLQSLEKLLAPGGRVIHIVPDYRCCFDALRYPSTTGDVLAVHLQRPAIHQGKQVFDYLARAITSNPGRRVLAADLQRARFVHSLDEAYTAMQQVAAPGAAYLDCHAWTFRPETFRLMLVELSLLGLVRLKPRVISPTYENQFCVVLERTDQGPGPLPPQEVEALERERLRLCKRLRV